MEPTSPMTTRHQKPGILESGGCVICHKPITAGEGNEEHPLPQWLLKLTESKKEKVFIHYNYIESRWDIKPAGYNLSGLKFPAHKQCNTEFDIKYERPAKAAMYNLMEGRSVSYGEVGALLDWFDKVRTTLFLGIKYREGNPMARRDGPSAIDRIGLYDRSVSIYRINSIEKRLEYFGPSLWSFQMTPSCLMLRVNDLIFINASDIAIHREAFGLMKYTQENCRLFVEGEFRPQHINCDAEKLIYRPISNAITFLQPSWQRMGIFAAAVMYPVFPRQFLEDEADRSIGKIFMERDGSISALSKEGTFSKFDLPVLEDHLWPHAPRYELLQTLLNVFDLAVERMAGSDAELLRDPNFLSSGAELTAGMHQEFAEFHTRLRRYSSLKTRPLSEGRTTIYAAKLLPKPPPLRDLHPGVLAGGDG